MMSMKTEKKQKVTRGARSNQKLKILYLMRILLEETDEKHALTMREIERSLEGYGIRAEHKSISSDMEILEQFGMDIVVEKYAHANHYHVASREFELAELKMLVDCIQAAKFISESQSTSLIKKLEGLTSRHEAKQLDRQVCVAGRVKTINERTCYNIDEIHEAISEDTAIMFQYFVWNAEKKMELKHDGYYYEVSPWELCWDDEKYYLVAYDHEKEMIKHFRVDKMTNTSMLRNCRRRGKSAFDERDRARYTSHMFGMFGGKISTVTLLCKNEIANIVIDRFGKDVPLVRIDKEYFQIRVKVVVSRLFLGWALFIPGITIISPQKVVEDARAELRRLCELYKMDA